MFKHILATALLALGLSGPVDAASVRELQLDEIIDTSTVAFQGTCTGNRTERDPLTNFVVTYTTFDVKDVLKGAVQTTHTIKQIGGKMPAGELSFHVDGVPTFVVGEDYVVFLAGVSSAGFSSPIGLAQGNFMVQKNATGKTVTNGRDFRELTARMPLTILPGEEAMAASIDLDKFKQVARARVNLKRAQQ